MSYLAARQAGAARKQQVVDGAGLDGGTDAHALAQAEIVTGRELARLGPSWRVLHSVPVGPDSAVLPHLVIGPHGAFAVSSSRRRRTVVDVLDGVSTLCTDVSESETADIGHRARQVRARLRERLGRAVDIPAVHPLICLTDGLDGSFSGGAGSAAVVPVQRLVEHLHRHPRRLAPHWVERLAAVAADPATWEAPTSECFAPDLAARYDALVRSGRPGGREPLPARRPDRVVEGEVVSSHLAQPAARSRSLRAASVLVLLLGAISLATIGGAAPLTLALGGVTLRHYGGWRWLDNNDYLLMTIGMGTAALSLIPGVFVWPRFLLSHI